MLKTIKSFFLKLKIIISEKRYKRLRYILQVNRKSGILIVCFSGFGNSGSAKYNYIRTLQPVKGNKLFILDNFGYKKQGSYYLGENGDLFLPDMISELITKIQSKRKINQIFMVGSSKGGSAALYYAIRLSADACIIGAPQYYIGDYLNTNVHKKILQGIMGNDDSESIERLNNLLYNSILTTITRKPIVHIHYSPKEHTYLEHIHDMIRDLEKNGYKVYRDANYDYTDHKSVAKFFPQFLLQKLCEMGQVYYKS